MDEKEGHEGRGPSLKHSIAEDLRYFNLKLGDAQQKGRETRDKNSGRKVVTLPHKEHQEVNSMEQTARSEATNENPNLQPPSGDGPVDAMLQAEHRIEHELQRQRQEFTRYHSLKADGIRLGAYGLVTLAAVTGGILISNAIINRGEPELPSGPAKK